MAAAQFHLNCTWPWFNGNAKTHVVLQGLSVAREVVLLTYIQAPQNARYEWIAVCYARLYSTKVGYKAL